MTNKLTIVISALLLVLANSLTIATANAAVISSHEIDQATLLMQSDSEGDTEKKKEEEEPDC